METIRSMTEVLDALHTTHGRVAAASKLLGVTVPTVYNYIERWPEVKALVEAERVSYSVDVSDTIQEKYLEALRAGRWPAILYGLEHHVIRSEERDSALVESIKEAIERVYGSD